MHFLLDVESSLMSYLGLGTPMSDLSNLLYSVDIIELRRKFERFLRSVDEYEHLSNKCEKEKEDVDNI